MTTAPHTPTPEIEVLLRRMQAYREGFTVEQVFDALRDESAVLRRRISDLRARAEKAEAALAERPIRGLEEIAEADAAPTQALRDLMSDERPDAPAKAEPGAVNEAVEALEWYRVQVEGCRKLGSIGDPFRFALDGDGGKRAAAAIAAQRRPEVPVSEEFMPGDHKRLWKAMIAVCSIKQMEEVCELIHKDRAAAPRDPEPVKEGDAND